MKRRLAEPETVPNETNTDADDELTAAIDSLSILTVNDLKTQLGELRLSKKGAKMVLVERLPKAMVKDETIPPNVETATNLIIYISKEGYVASGEIVGHNPQAARMFSTVEDSLLEDSVFTTFKWRFLASETRLSSLLSSHNTLQ